MKTRLAAHCLRLLALAVGLLPATLPPSVRATSFVWSGSGTDNNFNDAANWQGTAPANDGTADLHFAGTTRLAPSAQAAYNLDALDFDSGAGAFTLDGGALTVGAGGIANNSANIETINNTVTVSGGNENWSFGPSAGVLSFGSPISVSPGSQISLTGGATSLNYTSGPPLTVDGSAVTAAGLSVSGSAALNVSNYIIIGNNGLASATQGGTSTVLTGIDPASTLAAAALTRSTVAS